MKWYKVKVYFPDFTHEDEIRGTSEEDALKNAYWNWDQAERIELLREEN